MVEVISLTEDVASSVDESAVVESGVPSHGAVVPAARVKHLHVLPESSAVAAIGSKP